MRTSYRLPTAIPFSSGVWTNINNSLTRGPLATTSYDSTLISTIAFNGYGLSAELPDDAEITGLGVETRYGLSTGTANTSLFAQELGLGPSLRTARIGDVRGTGLIGVAHMGVANQQNLFFKDATRKNIDLLALLCTFSDSVGNPYGVATLQLDYVAVCAFYVTPRNRYVDELKPMQSRSYYFSADVPRGT